ncbi:UDP-N-acetylglucosamine 2-epimerase [Leptospira santarosai]|uniref:UDP-N-acetyl-D-glucosamine 2-epimerase, UDP-hydrolysing n=1 Tax=Leptospira santarosai str. ZUN179 TaxID=1049985 RepID=M6UXP4_9LEPT|nr:UDP-N-acetylglucosamine 2-epimerase [Leptospira santarosai]EMO45804.1 UDP-N-acetyl-D-glucosamine 2-epimerase, UDP-hydrolysing [Leptospira santarosai str. ZUN179]MDI7184871.1 UDP-N-acetylglucosamine 2-epimerase [Leptospira santarosai]MDI7201658.1 UDP-N-acetylglucosamine 2-epimerase [Leptospira santarosai]MDI7237474.1 UDP-N-acetylglucosamine 2-epimerase [Leptospira santarosai]UZN08542.1 UDP-N-acetylglucosamine 2-epimerase [Leptospira santarosai]
MKRKICVVTGTRAEYGLLYWLMREIEIDPDLELQIIATGMHLSTEFGLTYRQIEQDGFKISTKIEMLLSSDTVIGITKSMGLGIISFAETFENLKPDVLVLLGDRFELLAAAQAAMVARIPIAHISGGELTEGAFDEGIRHAITKLSHIHFVAAEIYRKRVIQMGEQPDSVFNFGAPGLDHLNKMDWIERGELSTELDIELKFPIFLVTYHPVTLEEKKPTEAMNELLNALEKFPEATIIFTYPNADTGGRELIHQIDFFVSKRFKNSKAFVSLGQKKYLSLMRFASVIIGNSSSGLTEAPALKKATVNIGDRQKGRLKADSVIDCIEKKEFIVEALKKALSVEHQEKVKNTDSLYGYGNVSIKIKEKLKTFPLQVKKSFFDLEHIY